MPKAAAKDSKEQGAKAPVKEGKAPAKGGNAPAKGGNAPAKSGKAPAKGGKGPTKEIAKDSKAKGGKAAAKGGKGKPVRTSWRETFPLFEAHERNYGIGGALLPKFRDLTRFVRWPKVVRVQKQKRILLQRLKVPPTVNQFRTHFTKVNELALIKLFKKYRPEGVRKKKLRLLKLAELKAKGESIETVKKPITLVQGVNAVTRLIESKRAKLVVIAGDVDPLEVVAFLPTLCRKCDVPYAIIKSKARLGKLTHRKTAAVVAITEPRKEDRNDLALVVTAAREQFNDNTEARKQWGGSKLGPKSRARIAKQKRIIEKAEKLRTKTVAR